MFPTVFTRELVRTLDWLAEHVLAAPSGPLRHRTGRWGEEHAYFYLRSLGYVVIARNYRSPRCHGEIDLIGWDRDMLCFVEVKTRTSRDIKPPEAAVDYHKRREVALVVREYLRSMPESCQWRFDIVSVYCDGHNPRPQFELFRNASLAA
jgi:putative endonuclease